MKPEALKCGKQERVIRIAGGNDSKVFMLIKAGKGAATVSQLSSPEVEPPQVSLLSQLGGMAIRHTNNIWCSLCAKL